MADAEEPGQFWFNVTTKRVEEGHQSSWRNLMGPYATRAEAEHALEKAAARNRDWDADDARNTP